MLQYIPIIGWAWSMSDVVFLERNWEKVIVKQCILYNKLNIYFFLFSLISSPFYIKSCDINYVFMSALLISQSQRNIFSLSNFICTALRSSENNMIIEFSFYVIKDKDNLARKLNNLLDFPSPVWLLIFPEGTR